MKSKDWWVELVKIAIPAVGCGWSFFTGSEEGVAFFCPLLLGMLVPGNPVGTLAPQALKNIMRRPLKPAP